MARRSTKRKTTKPGWMTSEALREAWQAAVANLVTAEHDVEKQMRALLQKNKISTKDARALLKTLGSRVATERKRAQKELEARLAALQTRVKKERKVLGRVLDDAVRRALAAFNIPSRHEVTDLTRRVEQLSRKIDTFKASPARR